MHLLHVLLINFLFVLPHIEHDLTFISSLLYAW